MGGVRGYVVFHLSGYKTIILDLGIILAYVFQRKLTVNGNLYS
jgi:hypothetical protein